MGAEYFLGVDGLSTLLILLTTMMGFIAILASWTAVTERVKEYYIFLLILQTGMLGAFMSLDFLLFFLFWEVMLSVPICISSSASGAARTACILGDQSSSSTRSSAASSCCWASSRCGSTSTTTRVTAAYTRST